MKTVLTILAFFSYCGAWAQAPAPSVGRELPRGEVYPCPTQQAAARAGSENSYFRTLEAWTRDGNVFSVSFTVPFQWANRQVLIRLASASSDYTVRVNGHPVAYNADGNTPAEFNVTRSAKEGRNELEIVLETPSGVAALESWKDAPAPAVGTAWVLSQPTMRVRDVATKTWRSAEEADYTAEVAVAVKSDALNPRTSRIWYELLTPAGETAAKGHQDMTLDMRREDTLRFLTHIPVDSLWSAEHPHLYTLRLKTQHEGRYDEFTQYRLGFRSIATEAGRMLINGQPVTLRVREVRSGITAAEIAALRGQGYNTLLLLPGSVDPSLYTACDTTGTYVIAQAPVDTRRSGDSRRKGGNPSNDPAWREAYVERARNSFHTSKRHPSVIAFSLARTSANGINLYESYLGMKACGDERPVIYPEAGREWNSDPLTLE